MMNTKFFEGIKSLQELKSKYKELARTYHPDLGGDLETMQKINSEYDEMLKYFEKYGDRTEKAQAQAETKIPDEFKNIIAQLLKYPKLHIEIVGSWIWLENVGTCLNQVKKMGFMWSKSHKKYYWNGSNENGKKYRASGYSMDRIKFKYGYSEFDSEAKEAFLN